MSKNAFFPDVPKDAWYAKYVCIAKIHNILNGYSDGTFGAGNYISFIEAAKIISNAFGYEIKKERIWYKPFVDILAEKKAIPTTIASFDYQINRGEMAKMIYRLKANVIIKASLDYSAFSTSDHTEILHIYFSTLENDANL